MREPRRPTRPGGARFLIGLPVLLCCWLSPAAGQAPLPPEAPGPGQATTIPVPDLLMTDQDGREVRLYDDVMKGKLVVLNFFYTTCQGVCPTAGFWFSKLQDRLGARLGARVVLVSISLDPERDTPEKIRRWAAHWKRKPGWTLLASKGQSARALTRKFLPDESVGMHSPVVFVGDGASSQIRWVSADIVDESKSLLNYLDQLEGR